MLIALTASFLLSWLDDGGISLLMLLEIVSYVTKSCREMIMVLQLLFF